MTNPNPLAITHPDIANEWHPTLNGDLTPDKVTQGSSKLVWWLGSNCQHEWDVKICIRTGQGQGCPICSNKRIVVGINDLTTTHPHLAEEWHPEHNKDISINAMHAGITTKVWWLGKCGHEWQSSIRNRGKSNSNCPYCAGQKTLIGFNDLVTTHPVLVRLWHPTKNPNLNPQDFIAGSKKRINWICDKGHEWGSPIAWQAIKEGLHCILCAGYDLNPGVNDFETMNPELAKEWHPTLNGDLLPSHMRTASHKKVWWLGKCGHEWQSVIKNRAGKAKTGCPECDMKRYVSKGEQAIADYLRSLGLTVEQTNRKLLNGTELDILIPEKKVAIEYNGLYYHTEDMGKGRNYHYDKWRKAKDAGYQLIQIWEDEWLSNPERIKNILRHKLGINDNLNRVFARKTSIVIMSTADAKGFFEANHIQGFAAGSYYYGLADASGNIVAAMVLKKEAGDVLNIVRYATSATVVGGFTKILKYVEKSVTVKSFITFSDNCISDGGLYENNGFSADKEIRPDYRYVVGLTRAHKFGYRLKRFRNDPELLWQDGLTERELAKLNNLPRIWDAGKTRWVKNVG